MGISVTTKTKAKASLKLANSIRTYLFEQECNELRSCSAVEINKLREALSVLVNIVNKNK